MPAAFRWSIAAAMAAAASLAGPPAIAAAGDPVAFAKALYALPNIWTSMVDTQEGRSHYLTLDLNPLVGSNRTGTFKSALAFDPLADSRSDDRPYKLSDETFTLVGSDDDGTLVKVDFKNYDHPDSLTLQLVNSDSGDRWLLSDIAYASGGPTLRQLLQPGCAPDN
jgi:hypothetical protein